jgi:hypothetical protein
MTPGPVQKNGDSLLGIHGSIFSAGNGLAVTGGSRSRRIEFAFDQSGMCGLGGRTTATAVGTYNEVMSRDAVRATLMKSTNTPGILEWYLLSTGQNPDEALIDQGGARSWTFSCGIRSVSGPFDDAELYRFASGYLTPAEIAHGESAVQSGCLLDVKPQKAVIPLSLDLIGGKRELNLYNTSDTAQMISLGGPLTEGCSVSSADMFGRRVSGKRAEKVRLPARSFSKVVINEQV